MKTYIKISIVSFLILLFTKPISAKQYILTANEKTTSVADTSILASDNYNSNSDYPFFSFEYNRSSSQMPSSDNYNLKGMNSNFSAIRTELNYGWFLDKKKSNSVLLSSLKYTYLKTNIDADKVNNEIPNYIKNIPNVHRFYLTLLFDQKLKQHWEIIGSGSISLATDFDHKPENADYSINLIGYIQKRINNLRLGGGYVAYLIGNSIKGLPLGSIAYEGKRFGFDILAPISIDCKYKFKKKNMILLSGELDFSGYSITKTESVTWPQPDYTYVTNFDLRLSYDKQFADNLHWNLGIGYLFRELSFIENDKEVDNLTFGEALYLSAKVYYTF